MRLIGVSGNYGFLDQIAALQWIQNNIAQFGGDPNNVLIWGQSSGGTSLYALIGSPLGTPFNLPLARCDFSFIVFNTCQRRVYFTLWCR